jgi:hypothetical protein
MPPCKDGAAAVATVVGAAPSAGAFYSCSPAWLSVLLAAVWSAAGSKCTAGELNMLLWHDTQRTAEAAAIKPTQ